MVFDRYNLELAIDEALSTVFREADLPLGYFLKQSIADAHLAFDRLGAPATRSVRTRHDLTKSQEITLSIVERIALLSSASPQDGKTQLEDVHKILHEFQGTTCRTDGGWCDARDHAEAIMKLFVPAKL